MGEVKLSTIEMEKTPMNAIIRYELGNIVIIVGYMNDQNEIKNILNEIESSQRHSPSE